VVFGEPLGFNWALPTAMSAQHLATFRQETAFPAHLCVTHAVVERPKAKASASATKTTKAV
jgi:hypothetical protein